MPRKNQNENSAGKDGKGEKDRSGEVEHGISLQSITGEMRTAYLDYAMSVIVGRALPDVRDGLKPVRYFLRRSPQLVTEVTQLC